MNTESAHQDQWDACPAGELQRMVGRIKARRQRRLLTQVGSTAAALLTAFAAAFFTTGWLRQPTECRFGGIACSEVKPLLPDFLAEKLDAELARKVDIHLQQCPDCGPMYRRMVTEMGHMAHVHRAGDLDEMHSNGREVVRGDAEQVPHVAAPPGRILRPSHHPT